jgi:hypothetical protein
LGYGHVQFLVMPIEKIERRSCCVYKRYQAARAPCLVAALISPLVVQKIRKENTASIAEPIKAAQPGDAWAAARA